MPGHFAYCVSVGGLWMLTRSVGVELGPHGICVVNIDCGAVATPINEATMNEATMNDPAKMKTRDAAIPLGWMASPQDIAEVVVFLGCEQGGYMTATTVFLDGGMQGRVCL